MNDEEKLNPGHSSTRGVLRVVGPLLAVVGLIFTIAGIGSFFASFGTFEPPRYFWCAFVGLPLVALGVGISKYAFMGRVFRYVAGETAPVAKDTFNYMAEGTQQGVRTMATAVGEGLRSSGSELQCEKCGQPNDTDAKFCRKCGASLRTTCPSCGHLNDAGASFCEACGKPIAMNPNP
jgi:hypothetical protein